MEKVTNWIKKNILYFIGSILGGIGGYVYWYFIGCDSGGCAITASPINSVIWGAMMGSLLLSMFKKEKKDE
jgi:hypothetical protein